MRQVRELTWLLLGCCLWLPVQHAGAQENILGLYVGGDIGSATIRQDPEANTNGVGFVRGTLGWDVSMGVRPLPYLGAEVAYLDFGSAHRYSFTPEAGPSNEESLLHESADAPAAFAVGYLPLDPWWDIYLKAGAARLHKSWDFSTPIGCDLNVCSPFPGSSSGTASDWDFAYGVGTQWKFGEIAWRLQYVRVNATGSTNGGDPDLLSVGATWTFF